MSEQLTFDSARNRIQIFLESVPNVEKVYFKAPPNVKLVYPCILYSLNDVDTIHANNNPYLSILSYNLTIIDSNATSDIPFYILQHQQPYYISWDRMFVHDGLYHWNMTLKDSGSGSTGFIVD